MRISSLFITPIKKSLNIDSPVVIQIVRIPLIRKIISLAGTPVNYFHGCRDPGLIYYFPAIISTDDDDGKVTVCQLGKGPSAKDD